jgi:hypothetical protein
MSGDHPLERLNYFFGRLLNAEDLTAEQDYFREKQQLHNRYLHGWGVVSGLGVRAQDDGIVVDPGVAIDCSGHELVLTTPVVVAVPGRVRDAFVTLKYAEEMVRPVPVPMPASINPGDPPVQFSRIREGCVVELLENDPTGNHKGMGPRSPGCGALHPLPIARLTKKARRWVVALMSRS